MTRLPNRRRPEPRSSFHRSQPRSCRSRPGCRCPYRVGRGNEITCLRRGKVAEVRVEGRILEQRAEEVQLRCNSVEDVAAVWATGIGEIAAPARVSTVGVLFDVEPHHCTDQRIDALPIAALEDGSPSFVSLGTALTREVLEKATWVIGMASITARSSGTRSAMWTAIGLTSRASTRRSSADFRRRARRRSPPWRVGCRARCASSLGLCCQAILVATSRPQG